MSTVTWRGTKVKAHMRKGAVRGLEKAVEHLLATSQPLVPVAPIGGGYLRDSGGTAVDEDALRGAVFYDTGDTNADGRQGGGNLAVVVHEDMESQHTTGQAKYLEQPFGTEREEVQRIIGREIRQELR